MYYNRQVNAFKFRGWIIYKSSCSSDYPPLRPSRRLQRGYCDGFGGVYGVAEWRISCLHSEVTEDGWVGLDAVAFFVIIGEIEKLKAEVCPLGTDYLRIQSSDVHGHILLRE